MKDVGIQRDKVFITSKVSPYEQGLDGAKSACESILTRLETDYLVRGAKWKLRGWWFVYLCSFHCEAIGIYCKVLVLHFTSDFDLFLFKSYICPFLSRNQQSVLDKARMTMDHFLQDLVLIHWPGASGKRPGSEENSRLRLETWQVLEDYYKKGRWDLLVSFD